MCIIWFTWRKDMLYVLGTVLEWFQSYLEQHSRWNCIHGIMYEVDGYKPPQTKITRTKTTRIKSHPDINNPGQKPAHWTIHPLPEWLYTGIEHNDHLYDVLIFSKISIYVFQIPGRKQPTSDRNELFEDSLMLFVLDPPLSVTLWAFHGSRGNNGAMRRIFVGGTKSCFPFSFIWLYFARLPSLIVWTK